ncbi:hypothetical protein J6590_050764, partial [Homalodisca vitripennis]
LLLSSDPLISSSRQVQRKKTKPFSKETLQLLLPCVENATCTEDAQTAELREGEASSESEDSIYMED